MKMVWKEEGAGDGDGEYIYIYIPNVLMQFLRKQIMCHYLLQLLFSNVRVRWLQ